MMIWSYFHEVFQKSEILKNAVSGRWCVDSRYQISLFSAFLTENHHILVKMKGKTPFAFKVT